MRRSLLLRILWLSKPNEARYHGISDWIATIKDEVRTKLRALEVFIRAREKRCPYPLNVGIQPRGHPRGPAADKIVPRQEEATTFDTGLNIDTVGNHTTLTQRMGDVGEQ